MHTIIKTIFLRRGTAEKLRDQVKEAFSLPDAPQVLGPTLNFVGGPTFEAEDAFIAVSRSNQCTHHITSHYR